MKAGLKFRNDAFQEWSPSPPIQRWLFLCAAKRRFAVHTMIPFFWKKNRRSRLRSNDGKRLYRIIWIIYIYIMNRDSCRRIDLYYYLPNHLSYLTLLVNIFIINMISLLLTPLHQPRCRNVEEDKERDTILISPVSTLFIEIQISGKLRKIVGAQRKEITTINLTIRYIQVSSLSIPFYSFPLIPVRQHQVSSLKDQRNAYCIDLLRYQ